MITAVMDACVLYSAPLRDLWMHLTVRLVFQPKWTSPILTTATCSRQPKLARRLLW